jgi:HEPN domain-containing protein
LVELENSTQRRATPWLRQAEHDLIDAQMVAAAGRHALACFLCHQAAEKALTAYLLARGAEQIWGHALADLCEDAMAFDASFDLVKSVAVLLDRHYLGARYPTTLPGGVPAEAYEQLDASRALEIAQDVLRETQAKLSALSS